jgi:phytoene dehydrogenase-like protein
MTVSMLLALKGYSVTLFEANDSIGGTCVTAFRNSAA